MKLLIGTLILSGTAAVFAQDAPAVPATPATPAKPARIAIVPANGSDMIVASVTKNAPFTADESGESVRVLPDGNRITDNWTGKIARNSQGYTSRQITSGKAGGSRPFMFEGPGGTGTTRVFMHSTDGDTHKVGAELTAVARAHAVIAPREPGDLNVVTVTGQMDEAKRAELAARGVTVIAKGDNSTTLEGTKIALESGAMAVAGIKHDNTKFNTRKESLGTRDFSGVQAEGTRIVTTYAVGAVGNEREIEVTSEIWFSRELGVIVSSRRSDPRTGDTTYQMTNIVRAEPDPSLFQKHLK